MVYSELVDGVFCSACAVFSVGISKGKFFTQPFRTWNKKGEKAHEHERCSYHFYSLEKVKQLKQYVENPETTITAQIEFCWAANIKRNKDVLNTVASAILYCGKQCIALHGYAEDLESP